nr:hypothetical protein [Pseudorhodoplanes sinuspersici]
MKAGDEIRIAVGGCRTLVNRMAADVSIDR